MREVIQLGDTLKVAVFHFLTRSYATRTNVLSDSSVRGHCFAQPNLLSSSRLRSIFKATSQPSSTSPTASHTTLISLDLLIPEHGAFYIMDRGYVDFVRAPVHVAQNRAFLRHPRQVQYQIQASLLSSRGRIRWCSRRLGHSAERIILS